MRSEIQPSGQVGVTGIFGRFADGAAVGDVIPFFDEDAYHLFCLTPPPGTLYFPERLRTTWRHLRSFDLRRWEQLPDALAPGDGPDRDGVWTGSVLKVGRTYHLFYTGHSLSGAYPQTVCHATSDDGVHWQKDVRNPVSVPDTYRFEGKDWRDPFVMWNADEQCYWMLVSTRSAGHAAVSRGVVALQTSTDLVTWSAPEELYQTFLAHCPECPELFRLGDKWVLGYSRFTDRRGTVYRYAHSPRGPWHHFASEGPDGANWYAAKSLTDGQGRRVAFGWVPDRNPAPSADTGRWLWAGDLAVPRQLYLEADDGLHISPCDELDEAMSEPVELAVHPNAGNWSVSTGDGSLNFDAACDGQFGFCVLGTARDLDHYVVRATIKEASHVAIVGVVVQTSADLDRGVAVLCYPSERRVCAIDIMAVRSEIANEYEKAVTEYASVVEGSVSTTSLRALSFTVIVRSDVVEAFVGGSCCLTYRLGWGGAGAVALLADDGHARFEDVTVCAPTHPLCQAEVRHL